MTITSRKAARRGGNHDDWWNNYGWVELHNG
jgi:hypothetical protein